MSIVTRDEAWSLAKVFITWWRKWSRIQLMLSISLLELRSCTRRLGNRSTNSPWMGSSSWGSLCSPNSISPPSNSMLSSISWLLLELYWGAWCVLRSGRLSSLIWLTSWRILLTTWKRDCMCWNASPKNSDPLTGSHPATSTWSWNNCSSTRSR